MTDKKEKKQPPITRIEVYTDGQRAVHVHFSDEPSAKLSFHRVERYVGMGSCTFRQGPMEAQANYSFEIPVEMSGLQNGIVEAFSKFEEFKEKTEARVKRKMRDQMLAKAVSESKKIITPGNTNMGDMRRFQ